MAISSVIGTGVGNNNSSYGNNNGACHMRIQFGVVRTTSAKHCSNNNNSRTFSINDKI